MYIVQKKKKNRKEGTESNLHNEVNIILGAKSVKGGQRKKKFKSISLNADEKSYIKY